MKATLQLALEALKIAFDQTCSVGRPKDWQQIHEAITAIKEALAQPEQEPVAWIDASSFAMMNQDPRFNRVQWQTTLTLSQVYEGQIPLYTTPPQRTWVGLTDEEIEFMPASHRVVAKWAETKLKEKNT